VPSNFCFVCFNCLYCCLLFILLLSIILDKQHVLDEENLLESEYTTFEEKVQIYKERMLAKRKGILLYEIFEYLVDYC